MNVTALQPVSTLALSGPAAAAAARPGASFGEQLRASRGAPIAGAPADAVPADLAATARKAARELVAAALVQPVLAEMRDSGRAEGPFAPGDAERRFGPMLDQKIADRITSRPGFPLVERLEAHLLAARARSLGAGGGRP